MKNRLIKQSAISYTPAVPAIIARPAYCTTTREYVQVWVEKGSYVTIPSSYDPNTTDLAARLRGGYSDGQRIFSGTRYLEYRWQNVTTCYPATAGRAGRDAVSSVDNQVGWNAGAYSLGSQPGNLVASFVLDRSPNGVLCGLAKLTPEPQSFQQIEHGLFSDGGFYQVYESGRLVHTFGQHASNLPELQIIRRGVDVSYRVGSEEYRSGTPSRGVRVLAAMLYVAGDYVESPTLGALGSMAADIDLVLSGSAGAGTAADPGTGSNGGNAPAYPMDVVIDWTLDGDCYLGNLAAQAAPPVIDVTALAVTLPVQMSAVSTELANEYLDELSVPFILLADEELTGQGLVDFSVSIEAWEETNQGTTDLVFESMAVVDGLAAPLVIYTLVRETLTLGTVLEVLFNVDDTLFEALVLREGYNVAMLLQEILAERLVVSDDVRAARQLALQYATNLATGAVTRYQGYDFKGYLRAQGDTFAWRTDGLYRLGGDTDNGQTLNAMLEFAADDFGSSASKYGDWIYFGLNSDGEVMVKVIDDSGREYTYRVQGESPTVRAQLGRGLQSKLWRTQLHVTEASQLELDRVEWVMGSSSRRLAR